MASQHTPFESDVKDAWVDFMCDHSNTPLTLDEAERQFEQFMRKVKAEALFDYADYLEATASSFADMMTEEDSDENDRNIAALRAYGHQIKEGS